MHGQKNIKKKNVGCCVAEHKSEHFLVAVFLKTEVWEGGYMQIRFIRG